MFARFYFIGDDDMLEILGQATNPLVIQTHLKKLFAGIHVVKFDDKNENILAMKSLDGEHVQLSSKVKISHQVEVNILRFQPFEGNIVLTNENFSFRYGSKNWPKK